MNNHEAWGDAFLAALVVLTMFAIVIAGGLLLVGPLILLGGWGTPITLLVAVGILTLMFKVVGDW